MNHAVDTLVRELDNLKNYNETKRVKQWRKDVEEALVFIRDEIPERKKVLKRSW